jgi:hypothetical protein
MVDQNAVITQKPARAKGEPPASTLDPFVEELIRWIDAQERGVSPNSLAKNAAAAIGWPLPFAEAVATATRARRFLTLLPIMVRGGYRLGLSQRGRSWLATRGSPDE